MNYLLIFDGKRKMVQADTPYMAVKSEFPDHDAGFCSRLGNRFTYMVERGDLTSFEQIQIKVYEVDEDKREKHCYFSKLNIRGRCIANCHLATTDMDCTGNNGKTEDYEGRHEVRVTMGYIDPIKTPAETNEGAWGGGKVPAIYQKGRK